MASRCCARATTNYTRAEEARDPPLLRRIRQFCSCHNAAGCAEREVSGPQVHRFRARADRSGAPVSDADQIQNAPVPTGLERTSKQRPRPFVNLATAETRRVCGVRPAAIEPAAYGLKD